MPYPSRPVWALEASLLRIFGGTSALSGAAHALPSRYAGYPFTAMYTSNGAIGAGATHDWASP